MPNLLNLFVNPRARVLAQEQPDDGSGQTVVAVDGLVCGLCALRVRQALDKVPGVTGVEYSPTDDTFTVRHSRSLTLGRRLVQAAESMVIAPTLRRALGFRRGDRTS